jgi:murein DD-endopeptidase MepM/ murein hydrolase activator NlpD
VVSLNWFKNKPESLSINIHTTNPKQGLTLKVKTFWALVGLGVALLIMVLALGSIIYSSMLARRLVNYHYTIESAENQKKTLDQLLLESENLKNSIEKISLQDKQLKGILGLPVEKKTAKPAIVISDQRKKLGDLHLQLLPENNKILANLGEVKAQINEKMVLLERMRLNLGEISKRLALTPTGWPLWGRVVSYYGWRTSPWVGMHTGVDITAVYGAPIRATADGIVSLSGWKTGYGQAVIIEHGSGVSTLYGHCSSLVVHLGQKVKKGQLIAYVGSTGYSTGPHLHYEVRKNDHPVNPMAYLEFKYARALRKLDSY